MNRSLVNFICEVNSKQDVFIMIKSSFPIVHKVDNIDI